MPEETPPSIDPASPGAAAADAAAPAATAAEDRVPVLQKIIYGMGTANDMWGNWLYPSMVWPVFNIFLHVNPALISTALMINRLADAVSDPFFGWLSDNTRSRWGRRRPYILVGSILSGLTLPLLFFVSPGWSEQAYFWYMVISSSIFITIVSCFNMPYQSLGAELTPDYHERTSVFSYKSAIQKIAEIGTFFAAAFITLSWFNDPDTGEPDMLQGARVYTMILGAMMIVIGVLLFVFVRERYYDKLVARKQTKVNIAETIWKTLQCRPFRAQLAMALSYGLGTSMIGTLGYYMTVYYVCGSDVALGSKWNFAMGISSMVLGFAGVPVFAWLAHRLGKRHAMMVAQVAGILVYISTWWTYNPDYPALQLLASGSIAFIASAFWMLYGSIGADVIDYDELESGKRREGAFSACGSWIMKVGLAVGMGLSGVVLKLTGFDAALDGPQAPETLFRIRLMFIAIPIAGLLLALVALARFGLSRERMYAIRAQLEARRGRV
ncbi:MAG: MFS transporter [Verrucomicrobia bacterium]|nr:MAG: MFS transporter [Verrucomicrobiota bacterium]